MKNFTLIDFAEIFIQFIPIRITWLILSELELH